MADQESKSPDALLADLRADEPSRQARLKVFLGMCPGVGKTYAMLRAAHQLLSEGVKVVVGVAETHGRAEIVALLDGMPAVPLRQVTYRNMALHEMDLDGILALRPDVVMVDELAHTNAPGSRHPKRYQDVLELLDAGISVYSTLNVQHIESRVDVVRQITGVTVLETVPDSILDRADEIQLIDLTPEELRQRLKEGKVYLGERAQVAGVKFFRQQNLVALREMALRLATERADQAVRQVMRERNIGGPWKSSERLMVAVGGDAGSESLIRWTRRVAGEFGCSWLAVYVDPDGAINSEINDQLTRNLSLVRQLGGNVLMTSGKNRNEALLRVARDQNVTQIVVGKPAAASGWGWLKSRWMLNRLIHRSGAIDVYVVQADRPATAPSQSVAPKAFQSPAHEFLIAGLGVTGVTAISLGLESITGYLAVALLYLLLVVVLGARLGLAPVFAAATLSALLWNFLFIPPHFTFYIGKLHDAMIFAMFFIVALAMGHLTGRLRQSEIAERKREQRTAALYELAHQAAFAPELETGLRAAVSHIESIVDAKAALLLRLPDHTLDKTVHPASSFALSEKEQSVAAWAFSRRVPAGRYTDTLPDSEALHLPLQARTAAMGVLCIRPNKDRPLDISERDLLEAFAVLIGLLLEKDHIAAAIQRAELLETSERLRRSILDSVSHELKTPLAAVQTGLEALEQQGQNDQARNETVGEIKLAVRRLNRVISNLLEMTRIEAGVVQPKLDWCDIDEVVEGAVEIAADALAQHRLALDIRDNLPMIKIDHLLIEQSLANLLANAANWSPAGTTITVGADIKDGAVQLVVADRGPGIPDDELPHVFEKFYRGAKAPSGGSGLGLSIVEGFVRAHGGSVRAENRSGGGAEFTIRVPVETLNEKNLELGD
ncbi:MAG TPA: sensor histidine kinase KdpD [Candidatus Binatia bacterium]